MNGAHSQVVPMTQWWRSWLGRELYGDELPNGTRPERDLSAIVRRHERLGVDGYRAWLAEDQWYREMCETLDAATG